LGEFLDVRVDVGWRDEDVRPVVLAARGPAWQQVVEGAVGCAGACKPEQGTVLGVGAEAERERTVDEVELEQQRRPAPIGERRERGGNFTATGGAARRDDGEHAARAHRRCLFATWACRRRRRIGACCIGARCGKLVRRQRQPDGRVDAERGEDVRAAVIEREPEQPQTVGAEPRAERSVEAGQFR
jgi:hypothetical protein